MSGARILYLDSYTNISGDSNASDEIGYGITASEAIKEHLRLLGHTVYDLSMFQIAATSKLEWIDASYGLLRALPLEDFNIVFVFHSFHQFPAEIRRILLDRGYRDIKIVGYTHGSHWDPTDTFRQINYPGMNMVDLANLLSMDCVFVVSRHFRDSLLSNVRAFNSSAASDLAHRLVVTGLPINNKLIDQYHTNTHADPLQIVFNHSPTGGKDPEAFFRVMESVLPRHDVRLVVTRRFEPGDPGGQKLEQLYESFGDQVVLGSTMSLSEYYMTLWNSQIQVSTASHESLGIATLEAMYTLNCCLLPNRQSYPEIAGPEYLYNTERELLSMLSHYIQDKDRRHQVARLMHEKSLRYLAAEVVGRISRAMEATLLL